MIESELILSCDKKFVNFATFQILILQPNKNATNRNFGKKTRLTGCKTLFLQHRQNRSGKAMIRLHGDRIVHMCIPNADLYPICAEAILKFIYLSICEKFMQVCMDFASMHAKLLGIFGSPYHAPQKFRRIPTYLTPEISS